MLRSVFCILAAFMGVCSALSFKDCSSDPSNKIVTVYSLDLSPMPVAFPGNVSASLNLTVNQQISNLFVDLTMEKRLVGSWHEIPCIGDTNIGTCKGVDACTILDRILNGSSVISQALGQQVVDILTAATGHKPQCPINPETVAFTNQNIMLQEIPSVLAIFATGDYRIKIEVKDDPSVFDNLGCIQLEASITKVAAPIVG